ncbi:MAG TPA: hypothetical protein VF486_28035 [Actinomycetes bacterium]
MAVSQAVPPQQVLSNFLGLLPVQPGEQIQPLRTSGDVGIGTTDAQPQATIEVRSGEGFDHPQVQVAQTTPNDFARLRLVSTVIATGDPDHPPPPLPTPAPFSISTSERRCASSTSTASRSATASSAPSPSGRGALTRAGRHST